jgi:hypothetical protein
MKQFKSNFYNKARRRSVPMPDKGKSKSGSTKKNDKKKK